jgi:hypothetical protein
MRYLKRAFALLLFPAAGLFAQTFTCGIPQTKGDLTVSCMLMPYKVLSQALPGVYGTGKSDAIQFTITSPDAGVAAYRVTIKLFAVDSPVVRLLPAAPFNLIEIPVDDLNTAQITSLRIEKLRADPPLDFTPQ